jgi:hypothetical protein
MVPLKVKLWRSENASVMAKASFVVTEISGQVWDKFRTRTRRQSKNKKINSFKLVRTSRTKQLKMSNTCPKNPSNKLKVS